ncbi:hypothetical protein TNCV_510991 [Trichonephila clavipes]|nr:hypothetical protein TNCV_510991 [Trichonephila clavipes]
MRSFTGNDNYSVKAFFRDVEENFIFIPHISDLQKITCVKRLLQGPAKTFIQTLHNILTYSSLKAALIEEFEDLFCSYDVHKEMQKRKLRPTESLFEYFLAMREIASKAHFHLDDHSLIMYCITGIPDSNHNKLILYACKSISEFKEKLKIYEKVFMQNNSYSIDIKNKRTNVKQYDFPTSNKNMCSDNKFHRKGQFNDATANKSNVRIRCYNCGLFNHTSNECYHKNKGLKCFNCNQFGHKSSQCEFKKTDVKNEIVNEVVSEVVNEINSSSEMRKTVKINEYDFDALIDTGSTVTLVRYSVYANLGMPTLNPTKIKLTAFGKGEILPIGSFTSTIDIENRTFKTDVYVIDNSLMTLDLLIGTDILHQAEFKISSKGIELLSKTEDNCINLINVSESDNQFQLQHVPSKLHSQIIHLLHHYKPIKTEATDIQLKIVLTDDLHVVHKPRRFSHAEKSEITNQIQKWLDNKVIRPSSSNYASPIVLVKKKNGSTRLCVDYRKLNRKIIKDQFPLPLIEDVIDKLHSAKIFTTLDLKNGFFSCSHQ